MIKEKELAIKFMRGKAAKVKEFCDIEYFTVEDEESIKRMRNEKFKTAWGRLINVIATGSDDSIIGLSTWTCIFCYYYNDCAKCGYGARHGICYEDSDYQRIVLTLRKTGVLAQFYRDLLKSIQEADDEIL